jgi:hypothetical protein
VEKEISPSRDEVYCGEGLILRKVTLRVDKVRRSSDTDAASHVSKPVTTTSWPSTGRLPSATPGDGEIPGQWRGLGSESNIPYDNGVLGQGEFQGQTQSSKAAHVAAADEEPNYSPRDEFTGRTAEGLAKRLAGTEPGQPTQEQSAAPNLRNAS